LLNPFAIIKPLYSKIVLIIHPYQQFRRRVESP